MMAITHPETRRTRGARGRWSGSGIGFHPVIWALNGASNFVVKRILRIDVESDSEAATAEELRVLIERGERYGRARPGRGGHARRASSTCTSRRRAR